MKKAGRVMVPYFLLLRMWWGLTWLVRGRLPGRRELRLNISVVRLLMAFMLIPASFLLGTEPLHVQVDKLIEARATLPAAAPTSDSEFLRRIFLDFSGRIPSSAELQDFLRDDSPAKRQEMIDRLLSGPEYPRRMAEMFDVVLMERRGVDPAWEAYLQASFAANRPWDRMAAEILKGVTDDGSAGSAAFFYTKRLENYGQNPIDFPGLTRDVGRLFMGVNLQCAQCHDHLTIDDYKQVDFQGLFAVYQNLGIDKKSESPAIVEKPIKSKLEFVSVFEGVPHETGPRVPFGQEFGLPESADSESDSGTLALVAEGICKPDNAFFARNIANRLWFFMMGRGLVTPLDEHHEDNPPSHPELLDLLASQSVANKFDTKWLLRELALTKTYQRSSVVPEEGVVPAPDQYLVALERPLSAEQFMRSTLQALGESDRLAESATSKELEEMFVTNFGNAPGEPEIDFNASVKGALVLLNDERFLSLLDSRPGNLTDRLLCIAEPEKLADELFLSVLSRLPTDEERVDVAEVLAGPAEQRDVSVKHVIWALLTSTEFFVNH
jgi:hypothetical protein